MDRLIREKLWTDPWHEVHHEVWYIAQTLSLVPIMAALLYKLFFGITFFKGYYVPPRVASIFEMPLFFSLQFPSQSRNEKYEKIAKEKKLKVA